MKGYRKLLIVITAFAIAAFRPLTEPQANVIIWMGITALAANGVEHVKEMAGSIRGAGGAIGSVLSKMRTKNESSPDDES